MRIGVLHDSLNFAGGAERVCLKTVEALRERGDEVVLGTIEPTDWGLLSETMGGGARPDKEVSLLNFSVKTFRIYMSMLAPLVLSKLMDECDFCVGTNGDLMPLNTNVSYMHYLPLALSSRSSEEQYSNLLRMYTFPFKKAQWGRLNRMQRDSLVTNSCFSRDAIRSRLGYDAQVVYPPVEIEDFAGARGTETREKAVVACGRFSPEKNYELVLSVAELLPEVDFAILGTFSGSLSRSYYEKLCRIRESKGLKNVKISRSSFEKMLSAYSSSKVFLSAMAEEAFGLSVVEAMASGLVPVVHRSGGPWQDILAEREGRYGFSFSSPDEAATAIRRLLTDEASRREIAAHNDERVRSFSSETFKHAMSRIVDTKTRAEPPAKVLAS